MSKYRWEVTRFSRNGPLWGSRYAPFLNEIERNLHCMQPYPSLIARSNFYSRTMIEAEKWRCKVHDFDVKVGPLHTPSNMLNQGIFGTTS